MLFTYVGTVGNAIFIYLNRKRVLCSAVVTGEAREATAEAALVVALTPVGALGVGMHRALLLLLGLRL